MTNEVQKEETPNPYNYKKSWHEGNDKPFESADGSTLKSQKKRINYSNLMT